MIIFLHFHKCGGTSIISKFSKNKKFINKHINGNPRYKDGQRWRLIDFSSLDQSSLNIFVEKHRYKFMALEFSFFKPNIVIPLKAKMITCMRDPLERYISNYFHDTDKTRPKSMIRKGYNILDIEDYGNHNFLYDGYEVNFNKNNYYTKMLNGITTYNNIKLHAEQIEFAKHRLEQFDTVIILENEETFRLLEKYNIFEVDKLNVSRNKTKLNLVKQFIQKFKSENSYDYELYEFAKKLSESMLSSNKS